MPSWNDTERAELLARYRRSGLSQGSFSAQLRAEGIELSPRTLRAWATKLEPPDGLVEECLAVVDRAFADLRQVRAMLMAVVPPGGSGSPVPSEPAPATAFDGERAPGEEPAVPTGSCVRYEKSVSAVVPTVAASPLPNGMPAFAPSRRVGRLRFG